MAFPNLLTAFSTSLQSINPFATPPNLPALQSINPFGTPPNSPAFDPTVADVLTTKAILQRLSLPLELTDTIIDYAE